jgi:HJR/Mrr/RecB family endonuclease
MKFNTSIKSERKEAMRYFMTLANKHQIVEVKKVSPRRTLPQNAYLHLLLAAFGQHFGYDLEESKHIYKTLSPGVYEYTKKGRTFWRSSADLTKEEMAKTIDTFMKRSAEAGYPLPLATNPEWIMSVQNEIERSKYYL